MFCPPPGFQAVNSPPRTNYSWFDAFNIVKHIVTEVKTTTLRWRNAKLNPSSTPSFHRMHLLPSTFPQGFVMNSCHCFDIMELLKMSKHLRCTTCAMCSMPHTSRFVIFCLVIHCRGFCKRIPNIEGPGTISKQNYKDLKALTFPSNNAVSSKQTDDESQVHSTHWGNTVVIKKHTHTHTMKTVGLCNINVFTSCPSIGIYCFIKRAIVQL